MSTMAQVRRVLANDEEISVGFNSASGLAVGTRFDPVSATADPVATGQTVFSKILRVDSHQELMDHLDMSFDAEGRYGFFKGVGKRGLAFALEHPEYFVSLPAPNITARFWSSSIW